MKSVLIFGSGSIGNHMAFACRKNKMQVYVTDISKKALNRMREEIYPRRYGSWDNKINLTDYSDLKKIKKNFDLIIIGTPPKTHIKIYNYCREKLSYKKILIELVNALELKGKVIFLGYITYDQIPKYYALSRCFILPSTTEQWGLVVNEALASGVPVIVSEKCGSAPELVSNNNVGYTFDPIDKIDLLDKMIKMTDNDLRLTFSKNTFKIISDYGSTHFGENLKKASKDALTNFIGKQSIISKIILNILIIFNRIK